MTISPTPKGIKAGVFISHIVEERLIAGRLKRLLQDAFGSNLSVFVSSDYESIRGGTDWQVHIVETLKRSAVVLVLCSHDSVQRPWINYEAGVGDGTHWEVDSVGTTHVIPVVVRGYEAGKLLPPLSRKQARNAHNPSDALALLNDVALASGMQPSDVDLASFTADLNNIAAGIQVRHDHLNISDTDFEAYVKGLIVAGADDEFAVLMEDIRERTVDCWKGDWPHEIVALADRIRTTKEQFLPAIEKLTLLGILLVKNAKGLRENNCAFRGSWDQGVIPARQSLVTLQGKKIHLLWGYLFPRRVIFPRQASPYS